MKAVKLYGYATSPFVRKTGCFLHYKGIEFTHIPVDPTKPNETIGFTGRTQVPVLEVDGEWRLESSAHAHWLDELFPEAPLCPPQHRAKINEIDAWISDSFLLSIFRYPIDGPDTLQFRYRGWRLAALLSAHTPLPEEVRHQWPNALRKAPFIRAMAEQMDLTESISDMQMRIAMELVAHIGEGPFLGGFAKPTMLDLAVFPQLVWSYMFGLEEQLSAAAHPAIKAWLQRVSEYLPPNPTLVSDKMLVNSLQSGLR
ncbi:MAG: glutathione S-transferase family protein [Erythrobacter sp.]|uniref:glutathione S-transferase family protein n=1 Tax=Erythrobacter sp. TaxID=1042 RepID=UPI0032667DA1